MTAIILAGGKSSRFGSDKAFIEIGGVPLIKRQLKLLKNVFKKIIIVANAPERYKSLRGVNIIPDVIKDCGPLAGIYSGLLASSSFYNFVIACDMPFINIGLIRYIIRNRDNYDIIVPKIDAKFHPLFGIYSKNCIPVIKESLKRNRLKVSSIFPKLKTRFILKQEIERFGEKPLSLVNINTKKDLIKHKKD